MNLIQSQQEAVDQILALRENGPRAASYRLSFLNRSSRGLAKVQKEFERAARALGYCEGLIAAQWQDVKDVALLEARAE